MREQVTITPIAIATGTARRDLREDSAPASALSEKATIATCFDSLARRCRRCPRRRRGQRGAVVVAYMLQRSSVSAEQQAPLAPMVTDWPGVTAMLAQGLRAAGLQRAAVAVRRRGAGIGVGEIDRWRRDLGLAARDQGMDSSAIA